MDRNTVFTKTAKGITQVNQRSASLSKDLMKVLKIIDGKSNFGQLLEKAEIDKGVLEKALNTLTKDGFARIFETRKEEVDPFADPEGFDLDFTAPNKLPGSTQRVMAGAANDISELTRQQDKVDAERKSKEQAHEQARQKAKVEAESRAKLEAEARARQQAEQAAMEQAQRAKEASERARAELESKMREEEARKRAVAEQATRLAAEQKSREEAENRRLAEMRAQAEREANERARGEMERKLREEEAKQRALLEQQAKAAAELKSKEEAEGRRLAELRVKAEREAQALAEARARAEAEAAAMARARAEAEAAAKKQAESASSAEAAMRARLKEEIESRIRQEMEALLRNEVEEKTRASMQAEIMAEAKLAAKAELEERLREERETIAKAELAARANAEREAQARAESESKKRAEAEARAVAESEARMRAEEETRKLRAKVEEDAIRAEEEKRRLKAESDAQARRAEEDKARMLAAAEEEAKRIKAAGEEEARRIKVASDEEARRLKATAEDEARKAREAEARAKVESEARARDAASVESRIDVERQAKYEAEARAKIEAEERERRERELGATIETERKAKEEAEKRARIETRARETIAEDTRVKVQAELEADLTKKAEIEGKAQAKAYMSAKAQAELDEDQRIRDEQSRKAREIADVLRTKVERDEDFVAEGEAPAKKKYRRKKSILRPAIFAVIALVVIGVGALHVIPMRTYTQKVERALSVWLSDDVTINSMTFRLFPSPHLNVQGVAVGKGHDAKAGTGRMYVALGSLFGGEKLSVSAIELDGVTISAEAVKRIPAWAKPEGKVAAGGIESVRLRGVKMQMKPELDAFDAQLSFLKDGTLKSATVSSARGWNGLFKPSERGVDFDFSARNWQLPIGAAVPIGNVSLKGTIVGTEMLVPEFEADTMEGKVNGTLRVNWAQGVRLESDLALTRINVQQLVGAFTKDISVTGKLEGNFTFSAEGPTLEQLFRATRAQGKFRIGEGSISNVDLVAVMQSDSAGSRAGVTKFAELTGEMNSSDLRSNFRSVNLQGGVLRGNGSVDVGNNSALSGRLALEIRSQVAQDRGAFAVSGTIARPIIRRGG